jgi:septal ring factor EnvC (AmiA/AmiB activator)
VHVKIATYSFSHGAFTGIGWKQSRWKALWYSLVLLLMLNSSPLMAQTYEERRNAVLEKQSQTRSEIDELSSRIRAFEQQINATENEYSKVFQQYEQLNKMIALQDNKIRSLEGEQLHIQEEIDLIEEQIELRERELEKSLQNYRDILRYNYMNNRMSELELIVSAESMNQMIRRAYYLNKLESYKRDQRDEIVQKQLELSLMQSDLEGSLEKNSQVIDEIQQEKGKLNNQRSLQLRSAERLKEESSSLLDGLRQVQAQKENLENEFATLIAEEDRIRELENERLRRLEEARKIADAARRAEEVAKYSTPTRASYVSDETLKAYEQNFSVSKGKLPWPVSSTTVSKKFGITRNPLYGTRTEHPGINIVTREGEEVRVISDGYVFAVQPLPGYGNVVFVKHGSFYTVYGNLSEIYVNSSTILRAGTPIGKAGTNESEMGESIFFAVRKNNTNLNPEEWLTR